MVLVVMLCSCATENLKRETWHVKRDTAIIAARDASPEAQRSAKGAATILGWTGLPSSEPQVEDFEWDTRALNAEAAARHGLFSGMSGLFSGLNGTDGLLGGLAGLLLAAWQFYRAHQKGKMVKTQIGVVENLPDGLTADQVKSLIQRKMTSAGLEPQFHKIVSKVTAK